jgi:hypothetical protein
MGSPMLSSVNRLLKYRFYDFMELPNMRIIGYTNDTCIVVSDDAYHVCAVQLPSINKWTGNDQLWRRMFEGIHLSK